MSREIKFRAWDKSNNKMIYQDVYDSGDEWYSNLCINFSGDIVKYTNESYYPSIDDKGYQNKNFELMQFTGLTDKNGVDIYEGDIVTGFTTPNKYKDKTLVKASVKWDNKKSCWYLDGDFRSYHFKLPLLSFLNKKEVIGNIHENEELLK